MLRLLQACLVTLAAACFVVIAKASSIKLRGNSPAITVDTANVVLSLPAVQVESISLGDGSSITAAGTADDDRFHVTSFDTAPSSSCNSTVVGRRRLIGRSKPTILLLGQYESPPTSFIHRLTGDSPVAGPPVFDASITSTMNRAINAHILFNGFGVLVGDMAVENWAYTYDFGDTWLEGGVSPISAGYAVAYSHHLQQWLIGGVDATHTLAYSYTGLPGSWNGLGLVMSVSVVGAAYSETQRRWVIVGQSAGQCILTSTDGLTWSPASTGATISKAWDVKVTTAGTWLVAVEIGSSSVYRSGDGLNWTPSTGVTGRVHSIANGAGNSVVCGSDGFFVSTNDGASFSSATGGSLAPEMACYGVAYAAGMFVGTTYGTTQGRFSVDGGLTWNPFSHPGDAGGITNRGLGAFAMDAHQEAQVCAWRHGKLQWHSIAF